FARYRIRKMDVLTRAPHVGEHGLQHAALPRIVSADEHMDGRERELDALETFVVFNAEVGQHGKNPRSCLGPLSPAALPPRLPLAAPPPPRPPPPPPPPPPPRPGAAAGGRPVWSPLAAGRPLGGPPPGPAPPRPAGTAPCRAGARTRPAGAERRAAAAGAAPG